MHGFLGILFKEYKMELKDDEAIIEVEINKDAQKELEKEILSRIKVKKVTFKMNNEK